MADKLDKITSEINNLIEQLGISAWKAGMLMISKDATIDQISNLLSKKWEIDKEIIKFAMNRVKKPT